MITYKENIEGIKPGNLKGFFAGWEKKVTPADHFEILANSEFKILAMEGKEVVGFINAIRENTFSVILK